MIKCRCVPWASVFSFHLSLNAGNPLMVIKLPKISIHYSGGIGQRYENNDAVKHLIPTSVRNELLYNVERGRSSRPSRALLSTPSQLYKYTGVTVYFALVSAS